MRNIFIDLSSTKNKLPIVFAGYAGEHNFSTINVKLPDDLINKNTDNSYLYDLHFETAYGEKYKYTGNFVNDILSFQLVKDLTKKGTLEFQVKAYQVSEDEDGNSVFSFVGKTQTVNLKIEESIENIKDIPNGVSYEIPANIADELRSNIATINNNINKINMVNVVIPAGIPDKDETDKTLTFYDYVLNNRCYFLRNTVVDYSGFIGGTDKYAHVKAEGYTADSVYWDYAELLISDNEYEAGYERYCKFRVYEDESIDFKFFCNPIFTEGLGRILFNKADKAYVDEAKAENKSAIKTNAEAIASNKSAIETNAESIKQLEVDKANASDVANIKQANVNLFKIKSNKSGEKNGISYSVSQNGVITLNGTATARTNIDLNSVTSSIKINSGTAYLGFKIKSGTISSSLIISGLVSGSYKDIMGASAIWLPDGRFVKVKCSSIWAYNFSILQNTVFNNFTIVPYVNDGINYGIDYNYLDDEVKIQEQQKEAFSQLTSTTALQSISHNLTSRFCSADMDFSNNKWYGKKVAFVGDSFTANNSSLYPDGKSYIYYQQELLNLTVQNLGISGSTVSAWGGGANPMVNRLSSIDQDADLIIIRGGVNDYIGNFPVGNIKAKSNIYFYYAIQYCINYIKENYPSAKLGFITPVLKAGGTSTNNQLYTLEDYANAIIDVCQRNKIPCLDLYHFGSCNSLNINTHLQDGLHLSAVGIEAEKLIITSFISSI